MLFFSVGFFRNWKKVSVTVSGCSMRWSSGYGVKSKIYSLRGAVVIKTIQFRFQVSNMTEIKEGPLGRDGIQRK